MLYQKLRPYRFSDMVGQNFVVENVRMQAKKDAWFHSYILAGQFGSGKTTMARIIAMAANCSNKDEDGNPCGCCESCKALMLDNSTDYKEIDGASNTGVDNIRDLKEYISFQPVLLRKKVVIIDEVHKLSNAAFNSLLKLLEEPPAYAIFILCTTEEEAIPKTVQSRCAIYRFGAIAEEQIANYLMEAAERTCISLTIGGANLIAKYSQGSMRNALKYLEQLSASEEEITEEFVSKILGIADSGIIFDLLSMYLKGEKEGLSGARKTLEASGRDLVSFWKEVERGCADVLIAKLSGISEVSGTESYKTHVQAVAESYSTTRLCALAAELAVAAKELRQDATSISFFVESCVIIDHLQETIADKEDLAELKAEMGRLTEEVTELRRNGISIRKEETAVPAEAAEPVAAPAAEATVEVTEDEDDQSILADQDWDRADGCPFETDADPMPEEDSQAPEEEPEADANKSSQSDVFGDFEDFDDMFEEFFHNETPKKEEFKKEEAKQQAQASPRRPEQTPESSPVASTPAQEVKPNSTGNAVTFSDAVAEVYRDFMTKANASEDVCGLMKYCSFKEHDHHLVVSSTDSMTVSMLMLFLNRQDIKMVEINFG